jgi:Glyoxalase superfamily protein
MDGSARRHPRPSDLRRPAGEVVLRRVSGCTVDWEEGDPPETPAYLQVSRGPLVLHLSAHHGDGTPGGVVLVEVRGIRELHEELHGKGYQFMNPGLEPGPGEHMLSTASW